MGLSIERLIALRKDRGWSQRELARRCGFGESLIRKYESGESDPSTTYLAILADQFGVSADYLLGRSEDVGGQKIMLGLTKEEEEIIDSFRHEGWVGIMRLLEKRIPNK
jgi:transcriptional regulator with XRE-family HTH domain